MNDAINGATSFFHLSLIRLCHFPVPRGFQKQIILSWPILFSLVLIVVPVQWVLALNAFVCPKRALCLPLCAAKEWSFNHCVDYLILNGEISVLSYRFA